MNRNQYKEAYEKWMSMREWEYGPVISPKSAADAVEFDALTKILTANLPDSLESLNEKCKIVTLGSPWEASFLLSIIQDSIGGIHSDRMIFRGQKRSSWKLDASADRLKNDREAFHRALLEYWFFGSILGSLHIDLTLLCGDGPSLKLALPQGAYLPIAQHYGAASTLLDFTADPSVAVYFASRDSENHLTETASVYCYRVSSLVKRPELANLKFAPPFFERPYLQKGIFVEMPAQCEDLRDLLDPDVEIRFPVLGDNSIFKIVRESDVELEPILDQITELRALAKEGVGKIMSGIQS